MIKNPESFPRVEVEWLDSTTSCRTGWVLIDELIEEGQGFCTSVYSAGYAVRETPTELWVVSSYYTDREGDVGIQGLIVIPKVSILNIDYS